MNKGVVLFWSLFVGILVFAFGVQFAYSQSGGFAITSPSSGVSHTSNEIVCNGCINSANIADGAVTSFDVLDGTISDSDVSNYAGIFSRKINGANGWHIVTPEMPTSGNYWHPKVNSNLPLNNFSGVYVEIICGRTSSASGGVIDYGDIISFGGKGHGDLIRHNQQIILLTQGQNFTVYSATNDATPQTNYQYLQMKLATNGRDFHFSRQYAPGTGWSGVGGKEPEATRFLCVVKPLSLCSDGNGGLQASCGP